MTAVISRLCHSGLHPMEGDNLRTHKGLAMCRACENTAADVRTDRVRARMEQLLVGFAYHPRPGWQTRSACASVDPELFDIADKDSGWEAERATRETARRHATARLICESCPVVAQCLGKALVDRAQGTRGGELLVESEWKQVAHNKILKELGL
jgi:Transcription factor WhiB